MRVYVRTLEFSMKPYLQLSQTSKTNKEFYKVMNIFCGFICFSLFTIPIIFDNLFKTISAFSAMLNIVCLLIFRESKTEYHFQFYDYLLLNKLVLFYGVSKSSYYMWRPV